MIGFRVSGFGYRVKSKTRTPNPEPRYPKFASAPRDGAMEQFRRIASVAGRMRCGFTDPDDRERQTARRLMWGRAVPALRNLRKRARAGTEARPYFWFGVSRRGRSSLRLMKLPAHGESAPG